MVPLVQAPHPHHVNSHCYCGRSAQIEGGTHTPGRIPAGSAHHSTARRAGGANSPPSTPPPRRVRLVRRRQPASIRHNASPPSVGSNPSARCRLSTSHRTLFMFSRAESGGRRLARHASARHAAPFLRRAAKYGTVWERVWLRVWRDFPHLRALRG